MPKNYRRGGLGALQDEYERAAIDLFALLQYMSDEDYTTHRSSEIESLDSIQKIMLHVVGAGYGYANRIRKTIGVDVTEERPKEIMPKSQTIMKLHDAISYSGRTFEGRWQMSEDDLDTVKMPTPWNVEYTLDQMMEHAIVHILRHRRQIERILGK
jgi:uncharacterized damage-inducible protein DinB